MTFDFKLPMLKPYPTTKFVAGPVTELKSFLTVTPLLFSNVSWIV